MTLSPSSSEPPCPAAIVVSDIDSNAAGRLIPFGKKAVEAGATTVNSSNNTITYHFPRSVADATDQAIINGACEGFLIELQNALSGTTAQITREARGPRNIAKQ
ncbi:hypothetical protein KAZ92_01480 [Candidatus Gracilibacteria bacterium]|nr:hypothetical protein [Candidatus Gracilibacteria bacterium]